MEILNQSQRIAEGPKTQGSYERVLDEVATIRMRKVQSYGEARYEDPDQKHQMLITYGDCYRKFIRLQNMFKDGNFEAADGESLRDAFADLANYAIMGMQQLDGNMFEPYVQKSGPLCIDQFAIATEKPDKAIAILSLLFDLPEGSWVMDQVQAKGIVDGAENPCHNKANLFFNYRLVNRGVEFEVLNYEEGANWIDAGEHLALGATASHVGIHCNAVEMDRIRQKMMSQGYRVVQEVITQAHTNSHIKDSRRYHYVIFDTKEDLGLDVKLICRLTIPEAEELTAQMQ